MPEFSFRMMTSKPALPVKPSVIRIIDTNGEHLDLLENNNAGETNALARSKRSDKPEPAAALTK